MISNIVPSIQTSTPLRPTFKHIKHSQVITLCVVWDLGSPNPTSLTSLSYLPESPQTQNLSLQNQNLSKRKDFGNLYDWNTTLPSKCQRGKFCRTHPVWGTNNDGDLWLDTFCREPWWRYYTETSRIIGRVEKPPVTMDTPHKEPIMQNFHVFFVIKYEKLLVSCRWFLMPWRVCVTIIIMNINPISSRHDQCWSSIYWNSRVIHAYQCTNPVDLPWRTGAGPASVRCYKHLVVLRHAHWDMEANDEILWTWFRSLTIYIICVPRWRHLSKRLFDDHESDN